MLERDGKNHSSLVWFLNEVKRVLQKLGLTKKVLNRETQPHHQNKNKSHKRLTLSGVVEICNMSSFEHCWENHDEMEKQSQTKREREREKHTHTHTHVCCWVLWMELLFDYVATIFTLFWKKLQFWDLQQSFGVKLQIPFFLLHNLVSQNCYRLVDSAEEKDRRRSYSSSIQSQKLMF
jgi:hypothetical protein